MALGIIRSEGASLGLRLIFGKRRFFGRHAMVQRMCRVYSQARLAGPQRGLNSSGGRLVGMQGLFSLWHQEELFGRLIL